MQFLKIVRSAFLQDEIAAGSGYCYILSSTSLHSHAIELVEVS